MSLIKFTFQGEGYKVLPQNLLKSKSNGNIWIEISTLSVLSQNVENENEGYLSIWDIFQACDWQVSGLLLNRYLSYSKYCKLLKFFH